MPFRAATHNIALPAPVCGAGSRCCVHKSAGRRAHPRAGNLREKQGARAGFPPKAFCKPAIYTGNADAIRLTPPKVMTLEQAIAYIDDDEMVEVTPKNIRIRKALLDPNERKKASRKKAA